MAKRKNKTPTVKSISKGQWDFSVIAANAGDSFQQTSEEFEEVTDLGAADNSRGRSREAASSQTSDDYCNFVPRHRARRNHFCHVQEERAEFGSIFQIDKQPAQS